VSAERLGWIWGPRLDVLVGCGGVYLLLLPPLLAVAHATPFDFPYGAILLMLYAINVPHYGATVVRVYDRASERKKYALFAVHATLLLIVLMFFASRSARLASLVFTIYVAWSPWHFAGQNYGLAMMFMRRRGVDIEPGTKKILHASFFLTFVLTVIATHTAGASAHFSPNPSRIGTAVDVLRIGIPNGIGAWSFGAVLVVYAGCIGVVLARLLRRAPFRDLVPVVMLVGVQALWFVVPTAFEHFAHASAERLAFSMVWISSAHSAQYLWITSYFDRKTETQRSVPAYYVKCFLAGSLVFGIPAFVFSPAGVGTIPYDAGFGSLVFAIPNLHHFILDGAIWKLRDGRIARALLRSEASADAGAEAHASSGLLGKLVVALGLVSVAIVVVSELERSALMNAPNDLDRARLAAARLDLIGYGSPEMHAVLAKGYALAGAHDLAAGEYRTAAELLSPEAMFDPLAKDIYLGLGAELEAVSDHDGAAGAYASYLERDAKDVEIRERLERVTRGRGSSPW
jgi:hypothetical protein